MRARKANQAGVGRYLRWGRSTRMLPSSMTGRYSCGNTCRVGARGRRVGGRVGWLLGACCCSCYASPAATVLANNMHMQQFQLQLLT
jgi:hypothetical protein